MLNNKTLLRVLTHLVPMVLIGLTLRVVWLFVAGDIGHPMWFFSSFAADPHEFSASMFAPFNSVPSFDAQGLMVVFLWPMYYLSGMTIYLTLGVIAVEVSNYLFHGVDVGFRAAWEERQAALKAQDQAKAKYARWIERSRQRAEAKAKAAGEPAGSAGWSFGAIVFGVFLGWLLFH